MLISILPDDASACNLLASPTNILPEDVFIVPSPIFPTSISPDEVFADNLLKLPALIFPELASNVTSFPLPTVISPEELLKLPLLIFPHSIFPDEDSKLIMLFSKSGTTMSPLEVFILNSSSQLFGIWIIIFSSHQ